MECSERQTAEQRLQSVIDISATQRSHRGEDVEAVRFHYDIVNNSKITEFILSADDTNLFFKDSNLNKSIKN